MSSALAKDRSLSLLSALLRDTQPLDLMQVRPWQKDTYRSVLLAQTRHCSRHEPSSHVGPEEEEHLPLPDWRGPARISQFSFGGAVQCAAGIRLGQLEPDQHLHPGTAPWMSGKQKWKED